MDRVDLGEVLNWANAYRTEFKKANHCNKLMGTLLGWQNVGNNLAKVGIKLIVMSTSIRLEKL